MNTPVPGPSSMMGAEAGVISEVISSASASLDGAMAPTRMGFDSQDRKNDARWRDIPVAPSQGAATGIALPPSAPFLSIIGSLITAEA